MTIAVRTVIHSLSILPSQLLIVNLSIINLRVAQNTSYSRGAPARIPCDGHTCRRWLLHAPHQQVAALLVVQRTKTAASPPALSRREGAYRHRGDLPIFIAPRQHIVPTSSHRLAISFMKLMRVASIELAAYLVISAEGMSMNMTRKLLMRKGL